ncbi:acetolactate synthase large subunit [Actinocorallia herbida]|uniref:Acetolactate synthase large subunit n=1 Tax=Actinocorallia herbida TaxID=58109 RepID=A0A3N1CXN4_9ACTN|nr:thiamine pyrophosphate-binding protein [Actinocorallia herbida]ROO86053.1 acetolactate synthase large subunit [Actinocorallia herbida]
MQVYEALVKGLESAGVDTAFGGNGENIASLAVALSRSRRIRPIMTRHEQGASFMACGYAMYTDRLGVCFATVGPGAFNLFTGLAVALSDSYPVLALTGYVALDWQGRGAVNDTSGRNGTPDSQAMFAATTKRSYLLTDPADTCDVLEEAINVAFEGRPGPVHLHVPQNLAEHGVRVDYRDPVIEVKPVRPDPARVEEIADVLADALREGRRIVVLAGFGTIRAHAEAAMLRFVERFQIPLLTTLDGKGVIAETHPLAVGVFAESGHASAWKAFREADVVLAVGNSLSQHATFGLREDLFEGKKLLQVNIAASEIGRFYAPDLSLVSDARLAVEAITGALEPRVGPVAPSPVVGQDYEARHIVRLPGEIHPGLLAQTIGRMLPDRAILLADAGAHLAWLGYHVDLEAGQNFRKTGAFGPMAAHVNGAIGVKLAHPDRTVVVGCGDGCYSLAGFELMTAVENDVPVIWVIFNDDEYKLVKLYQLATYGESALVEFKNPDFAAYARVCGADGFRVETLEEFEDAFRTALGSGRPTVIDAKITRWALPRYSTSPKGMVHGIWETLEKRLRHD